MSIMLKPNNMTERPSGDQSSTPLSGEIQQFLDEASSRLDKPPRLKFLLDTRNRIILSSVGISALVLACSLLPSGETGSSPVITSTPRAVPTVSHVLTAAAEKFPTQIPIILDPTSADYPGYIQPTPSLTPNQNRKNW
jgi:hypothetical protein